MRAEARTTNQSRAPSQTRSEIITTGEPPVPRVFKGLKSEPRPLELLLEVAQGEPQCGGAAVRAVAGPLHQLAPREQRVDLCGGEWVARLDGGLAGHHVQDFVEDLLLVQVE